MTTTMNELNISHSSGMSGMFAPIGRAFGGTMRAMQYSRLMQAMSQVSDEQLELIGLNRADFYRQARETIYGDRG